MNKMEYVQSIDPGLVNLSISTFIIKKNKYFKLDKLEIQKIKNYRNVINYINENISELIIEKQPTCSQLYGMILYLEGWCKAKEIKFRVCKKICNGYTYKERKLNSIKLFYERDNFIFKYAKKMFNPKLDDVADSFNLGYNIMVKNYNYKSSNHFTLFNYKKL